MDLESPRDLIRRGAERHAERRAVVCGERSLTYRQLAGRTAELAESLRRAGVGAGVQVALALPNSVAYLVWCFGVLEAGGVVVPLAPGTTRDETSGLLDSAGVRFLVAREGASLPEDLGIERVERHDPVEGARLWEANRQAPILQTDPWTPQGVLARRFSSGSTGRPKHMLRTEASVAHGCWHFCHTLGLDAEDVFLAVAPFHHAYGAINSLAAFHAGACVIVLSRFLPGPVLEAASRHRPTVFLTTPPMIEILGSCAIADGEEAAFHSLRFCICSTARLGTPEHDAFHQRFGTPVRLQYGSTETSSATVDLDEGFDESRVGRPYAGVEIGVFDDNGDPCPAGRHGRIGVRSPAACDGYIDDPDSTARAFQNGYVFPGDRGYLDDAGRLHVLGRSDVINIGGYKVDALEVEAAIRESLPVKDVVVLEGKRAGLSVVRAIVEADPAQVTGAMVVQACRQRLSPYKVPAQVEIMRQFERDAQGKVIRSSFDD